MDAKYDSPPWWPKRSRVAPPKAIVGTKITILGCGTSTGVPVLACKCRTCLSKDARNHRTRASITIQAKNRIFLIDTSPDLREQALRYDVFWVDAVLFTHPHADHIHGIDELRSYNYLMARRMPCYGNAWTLKALTTKFDYIFKLRGQQGGGKPMLDTHLITRATRIGGVKVQPLELIHGRLPVLGYRINAVAYITDCSYIPDRTFKYLKNLDVLVLDCLRPQVHPTHLNIEAALALARKINAKKTYFTHMGHEIEYNEFSRSLPRTCIPRMTDS